VSELEDCCSSVPVNYCMEAVREPRGRVITAVTRKLVKAQQAEKTSLCAVVNCRVCELAIALRVVAICKYSMNLDYQSKPCL
jgi:hypothetical protein